MKLKRGLSGESENKINYIVYVLHQSRLFYQCNKLYVYNSMKLKKFEFFNYIVKFNKFPPQNIFFKSLNKIIFSL